MIRKFLPVGQGAFYLEQFKNDNKKINIIYDCGSFCNSKLVHKEIRSNFYENEEIEIVFISHLHDDHVNGLEYLLNHCNVHNIILPYTYESDKDLLKLDYFIKSSEPSEDSFICKLITNPIEAVQSISPDTNVYAILCSNDPNDPNSQNDIDYNKYNGTIFSGYNVINSIHTEYKEYFKKSNWEYVPFNFREKSRKEKFYEHLENELSKMGLSFSITDINELLKKWENKEIQNALIAAYEAVGKQLNPNSLVLFSGVRKKHFYQEIRCNQYCYSYCPIHWYYCLDLKPNGCLYTGDYEANGRYKWRTMQDAYSDYWYSIGCVQIPHHGSYKNYNCEFSNLDAIFVISVGIDNTFRHPSGSVLTDLIMKDRPFFLVTEKRSTEVIFEVDRV